MQFRQPLGLKQLKLTEELLINLFNYLQTFKADMLGDKVKSRGRGFQSLGPWWRIVNSSLLYLVYSGVDGS